MTKTIAVLEIPEHLPEVEFTFANTPPSCAIQQHVWLQLPEHPRPVLGLYDVFVYDVFAFEDEGNWSVYDEKTDRFHVLSSDPTVQPTAWTIARDEDRFPTLHGPDAVPATISLY